MISPATETRNCETCTSDETHESYAMGQQEMNVATHTQEARQHSRHHAPDHAYSDSYIALKSFILNLLATLQIQQINRMSYSSRSTSVSLTSASSASSGTPNRRT